MCVIEFTIERWCALVPGLNTGDDWPRLTAGSLAVTGEKLIEKPELTGFPGMLRRRLSLVGKSAVHCLLALHDPTDVRPDLPAIFCSQYGEVARSSKLLASLAEEQPLSPTDFSLSVHNAVAGVYSIGCEQTQNITVLSAGPNGFTYAILEAFSILKTSEHQQVACVVYDAQLPKPYPIEMNECDSPYALAFLISGNTKGAYIRASLDSELGVGSLGIFDFLRFLKDPGAGPIQVQSGRSNWRYEHVGLD
jgi:hypothetical protein